jgi:hypothetical protein
LRREYGARLAAAGLLPHPPPQPLCCLRYANLLFLCAAGEGEIAASPAAAELVGGDCSDEASREVVVKEGRTA